MNDKPPYLADVQVGDKLYNFLKHNKEYTVTEVKENKIKLEAEDDCLWYYHLYEGGSIPFYLYAPVEVLDPKNLPPRPWKPKKGEWVWAWNNIHKNGRTLVRFVRKDGQLYVSEDWQDRDIRMVRHWENIAPFKGELPPGLEEER